MIHYYVSLALLSVFFAWSVLNQLPWGAWQRLTGRIDPWTFAPFWGFFGPRPAHAGVHVIFRDGTGSAWGSWREIEVAEQSRVRWLWNPGRHERKALYDLVNGLAAAASGLSNSQKLSLSCYYLALAAWVLSQPRLRSDLPCRQFALVEAIGYGTRRQVRSVFVSRALAFD